MEKDKVESRTDAEQLRQNIYDRWKKARQDFGQASWQSFVLKDIEEFLAARPSVPQQGESFSKCPQCGATMRKVRKNPISSFEFCPNCSSEKDDKLALAASRSEEATPQGTKDFFEIGEEHDMTNAEILNAQHDAAGHPVKLTQQGEEWIVSLSYPNDQEGHLNVCGMFYSRDKALAEAYFNNAQRIVNSWYVGQVWKAQFGKAGAPAAGSTEPRKCPHGVNIIRVNGHDYGICDYCNDALAGTDTDVAKEK